jgi:hypothetical protein
MLKRNHDYSSLLILHKRMANPIVQLVYSVLTNQYAN